MQRDRETVFAVIARSEATKQSTLPLRLHGLLRFARNDVECCGCLKFEDEKTRGARTRHRCVVPAKAGTHTPRPRVLARWLTASAPTNDGGYGSPLSRGRLTPLTSFRIASRRTAPFASRAASASIAVAPRPGRRVRRRRASPSAGRRAWRAPA